MRWDNLKIDAGSGTRLPGYRDATVRRFDAPEALDTRFYEVQAKSALNRVPEASAMPFRWTINPYRGCSHACVYCLAPETPVLMADGTQRAIGTLRRGDRIVGTRPDGAGRRFTVTEVLDRWSSVKPAHRVTLADGTELVASGDHRFLTDRGWRHVTGDGARPRLDAGRRLVGVGALPTGPLKDEDYRRGYVCGAVRGAAARPPRENVVRFAPLDDAVVTRLRCYGAEAEAAAVVASGRLRVRRRSSALVRELIAWPAIPSPQWRKGFLAGVFDAQGSFSADALQLMVAEPAVIDAAVQSLRRLGFGAALDAAGADGARTIGVRGDLAEHLRFFAVTDPAGRRRSLDGHAVASETDLRVVAVEPLPGARRLCDITTGTGDFIANGVISHNCFARPTHKYLDFDAGRDFEREIIVKVNVPEVLRAELRRPSWTGEHIAMGTNTDPYQWVEGRYRLMPGIWEALRDFRNPCSVLTKSPLVLRDLPLLREIAAVTDISANLSIPTIEEKAWRASEPHTPHPRKRMEAVAELNRNGIPTGILVAPLMPGINDDPRQVEEILALAAEAGARSVGGIGLHLRGEVRGVFLDWLRTYRPELVEHYEHLYARGAYLPRTERDRLGRLLRPLRAREMAPFARSSAQRRGIEVDPTRRRPKADGTAAQGPPRAVQEALF